ncbi:MAG: bifunctional N(6)-L-threonylcarbamoyladenine synthase/serine/threonine protein kinase [Nanoarchaeota archaeon]|nr:bifunctional N(6)-L-threonylcarbamoyladenine synthase/serine/threonine protein kinase [Nanoarchaeota archaeon]
MICLGIESTAHTFGIGIITDKGNVLANEKDSYTTEEGGIVPVKAVEHHMNCYEKVIKKSLEKAGLTIKDIDIIAFSQSPGLGHTLRMGAMAARSLAAHYSKPLIGVNHCIAHLEIGNMTTECKDPVLLYASGANTQIIAYEAGRYRIFGETLDIGIGNFLDSFARELGLGFPGGPEIYELAKEGKNYIKLPYVVKGMDVSFGGILTNLKQKLKSGQYSKEDLCFSVQETVFAMLLEVAERAMAHCDKKELLLGGGVACNKRLQQMAKEMCSQREAECFIPKNEFLVDNGAMIAWLGIIEHKAGNTTKIEKSIIKPYERTDEVEVNWR